MAKIQHHNFVDTINDMLTQAKDRSIIHLNFNSENWTGQEMLVGEKEMINFGTCGYLGLETHPGIIEETQRFAKNFGVQFSVSRAYLTSRTNNYLEELLSTIFYDHKVIVFSSTTLAHIAVIPIVIDPEDLIILDQQVHISIQNAVQLMAAKGVKVEMIRHSNLEMLEEKVIQNRTKYRKIWYMIDGVYSMFGDVAPIGGINALMDKYDQLNLYVDDAHGMSWWGKNGCGRIFEDCVKNGRTIYMSTLAKGFGCMGGSAVFPNNQLYEKVKLHGGPLAYSHPLPPPMQGAAIASAKIHLSDEIYQLQNKLKEKLQFTHDLLSKTNLPLLSNPETPIDFIGTGQPIVGYKIIQRLMNEGYFVNIAMFPAVSVKNTGLRFTITNHNREENISGLVQCISENYDQVLSEEGHTVNSVRKAFRLPPIEESITKIDKNIKNGLEVFLETDISRINQADWDACFYEKGNFDWESLRVIQNGFKGNALQEENWDFYYLIIKDDSGKTVLSTHFSSGIMKDDLMLPATISKQVEELRKTNKYHLCSKMLLMGSLFSEGEHLFVDHDHPDQHVAVKLMLQKIHELERECNANGVIIRDFEKENLNYDDLFHEDGYFKMNMPNSNILDNLDAIRKTGLYESLSKRNKKNIRQDVLKFENNFDFNVIPELKEHELNEFYDLFSNVGSKNLDINIFPYPKSLFVEINKSKSWEFIRLTNKNNLKTSAIICAYKTKNSYFPIAIGINYDENGSLNAYKQILYQTVLFTIEKGYNKLHLGFSADTEKRKIGAKQIPKVAYMSIKDQYNVEILNSLSINKTYTN